MGKIAISGTGLYTPPDVISNAELVEAYNEYVRRHNLAHADEIAAGTLHALLKSSDEFIFKASGIKHRHVVAKEGMLDPEIMCPRLKERPNEQLSLQAEMAVTRRAPGAGGGAPHAGGHRRRHHLRLDPAAGLTHSSPSRCRPRSASRASASTC